MYQFLTNLLCTGDVKAHVNLKTITECTKILFGKGRKPSGRGTGQPRFTVLDPSLEQWFLLQSSHLAVSLIFGLFIGRYKIRTAVLRVSNVGINFGIWKLLAVRFIGFLETLHEVLAFTK